MDPFDHTSSINTFSRSIPPENASNARKQESVLDQKITEDAFEDVESREDRLVC